MRTREFLCIILFIALAAGQLDLIKINGYSSINIEGIQYSSDINAAGAAILGQGKITGAFRRKE